MRNEQYLAGQYRWAFQRTSEYFNGMNKKKEPLDELERTELLLDYYLAKHYICEKGALAKDGKKQKRYQKKVQSTYKIIKELEGILDLNIE